MNTVNLLPDDLKPKPPRRRRWMACLIIPLIAVVWLTVACVQIRKLDRQIAEAEAQNSALFELVYERDRLIAKTAQAAKIREPLSALAVTALITQLMPHELMVKELAIDVPHAALPTTNAKQKPTSSPHVTVAMIGSTLEGSAILQYTIQLQRSGVVEDVRIQESNQSQVGDQVVHDFHLLIRIPLWRSSPAANGSTAPAAKGRITS